MHFEPVVEGLTEVKVETGEEEEDTVFSMRARLFRYARECDPPLWKEKGIGTVRLLRDRASGKCRLLMRRDKTHKICANHYVTPVMVLTPNVGSDRSWVWQCAADFSEPEPAEETLAIRFKNPENAALFKEAFEKAATINGLIRDGDKPDELAKLLESLVVVEAGTGEPAPEEPDVKQDSDGEGGGGGAGDD